MKYIYSNYRRNDSFINLENVVAITPLAFPSSNEWIIRFVSSGETIDWTYENVKDRDNEFKTIKKLIAEVVL